MNGADNVTAEKCKFYFDAHLPGWQFVAAATCKYNCYGYSTGKMYWIEPDGFNALIQDEYQIHTGDYCKADCILKATGDHCWSLVECCVLSGPDKLKKLKQKQGSSPIYQISFECPPGETVYAGTIYCKKP